MNLKNNIIEAVPKLRNVEPGDIDDLFEWRNHPEIRKNSFNTSPISRNEHEKWFNEKTEDPLTTIYIACCGDVKIGSIRFENKDNKVIKVSVMLNPDFFGKGFGVEIIKLGTEKFVSEKHPERPLIAEIKKDNIASIKAFQGAGFKQSYLTFIYSK